MRNSPTATLATTTTRLKQRIQWRQWVDAAVAEATGRVHRRDPVLPGTGGPAGNALLTAWTGLLLLVLFLIELVTLLNLDVLLHWHVIVGVLLVPPALLKTATTSWRIISYYTKRTPYWKAGPPPMVLRVLGPFVVIFTLALLGSGLALIALGPTASRTALLTVVGNQINAITIHQAAFVVWAGVTGLHTAGRLLPAMRIVTRALRPEPRVPGKWFRATMILGALLVGVIAATLVLGHANPWLSAGFDHD